MVGLTVSCWAVFVYFFVLTFLQYIQCVQKNKYIDWDIKTITAADYTVEFDLHKKIFETFLERYHDPSNPISEIAQFKLFIKDELEQRLTEMPNLGFDGEEGDNERVRIALITFAFNNARVINWLRSRGTHIKNENWAKLSKVNFTINT